jgi:UDP-glucose 4-epimerase
MTAAAALAGTRVLVTGGAGFIGSHLVEALVAGGAVVTVLDDFSSGRRENLADVADRVAVVAGDLLDAAARGQALAGAEVVMHLATRCVRLSFSDPVEIHRVNSEGTYRLLLDAVAHRVRRFVYVSSSEVYGSAVRAPMAEDHPLAPTTVYGATKLAGEHYTQAMTRSFGLASVVVRPFNTYGPRAHFEGAYGEVIPRFTVRLLNRRRPVIFGDGAQTRDFTEVSDTVTGILLAATRGPDTGQAINVARGEEATIARLASLLAERIAPGLTAEHDAARPADVRRHLADIALAVRTLGFTPSVALEDGLSRYVEWFRAAHPDPSVCLPMAESRNF